MFSADWLGVDLGSRRLRLCGPKSGIMFDEPSIVARDFNADGTPVALLFGHGAEPLIARPAKHVAAIRAMRAGALHDQWVAKNLLEYALKKTGWSYRRGNRNFLWSCSDAASCIGRNAVIDLMKNLGLRRAHLVNSAVAAAIGAGSDIFNAESQMIVNIGAEVIDFAVISSGYKIHSSSKKIGCSYLDDFIKYMLRRDFGVDIGCGSAENIRLELCSNQVNQNSRQFVSAIGRSISRRRPERIVIGNEIIFDAVKNLATEISSELVNIMEQINPTFIDDISRNGIILTGGGALVYPISDLVSNYTEVSARIAANPADCVAQGLSVMANYPKKYFQFMEKIC